jgi:hypothetical protein
VAVGEVLPANDGLRVAFAGDAVVYKRLAALPRLRMVSKVVHQPDDAAALRALAAGQVPADTVLLDGPGPAESLGGTTSVRLRSDDGDRLRLSATSTNGGWVVVADALQHGWSVKVDGRPANLVHADLATVAVRVGPGDHAIDLRYDAPGFSTGKVVSALSVLGLAAVGLVGRRRRRQRVAEPPPAA